MATDLQVAMYTLSGYPAPQRSFYLDVYPTAPDKPASLEESFGAESMYPYKELFNQYYDQEKNLWTTGDLGIVSQEIRDDVQDQLDLLVQYDVDYSVWNEGFVVAQDVAWRKKIAEAILSVV